MIMTQNDSQTHRPPQVGVSFLLSQVGAHGAGMFEDRLAPLELKPHHAGLLRMLGTNPGLSQQEMSELFGVFPSRLVELLDQLEARQFIERRANPQDRRGHRVFLTRRGRGALQRIARLTRQLDDDLTAALAADEREQLCRLLLRVVSQQKITPAVHPAYRKLREAPAPQPKKRTRTSPKETS